MYPACFVLCFPYRSTFCLRTGKAVSKKEREELNLKDSTLVYGEITFDMLGTVLEKIKKVYGRPNVGASGASGNKFSNLFLDSTHK